MTKLRAAAALLAAALVLSCMATLPPRRDHDWAARTLASLTLEEKAAQVLMVVFRGYHTNPASPAAQRTLALVRDLGVGGLILSRGDPLETVGTVNRLQGAARLPLLVAADLEWGVGVQVPHGATPLPYAMAVGATDSEAMAEAHGRATAKEARALGIHLAFAPVLDVNNNPDNPIISIRAYGEDPERVARLGAAFIRGARAGGLLTTAKHFPGHGDTAVDSHRALATVAVDRARLDAVELLPFRAAIASGVDAVMIGHLAVPALDPSGVPATVSHPVVTGLLRQELGFRGLVVSDALDMRGVTDLYAPGEAAVRTLEAGQDVLLMSPDPEAAHAAIVAAVRSGRLPLSRLDDAVSRILAVKARLGLAASRTTPSEPVWTELGDPATVEGMEELARHSITLVKNEGSVVPIRRGARVLHVVLSGDALQEPVHRAAEAELRRRAPEAATVVVDPRTPREALSRILEQAGPAEAVLVSAFVRVDAYKGTAALPAELAQFLTELATARPIAVVAYGSPYLLRQFPGAAAYLCAYGQGDLAQHAAVGVVFGETPPRGRLPVTLPGLFPRGHGLTGEARPTP